MISKFTMFYVGDNEDGNCIIECENCGEEFDMPSEEVNYGEWYDGNKKYTSRYECPHCNVWLYNDGRADW